MLYHYTTTESAEAMLSSGQRQSPEVGQPGEATRRLGRRAIFFYGEHTPRGTGLNHPKPDRRTDAVITVRGHDLAQQLAGARCYRRQGDHAVAVCGDYHGPYRALHATSAPPKPNGTPIHQTNV